MTLHLQVNNKTQVPLSRLAVIALSLLLALLSAGIPFGDFHWPIRGYPAISTPSAQTGAVRGGAVNKSPPHSAPRADLGSAIPAQQWQGGPASIPSTLSTFAELPSTDDQAIGFTGYVKDSETGLYYAKARYYDPRIARFVTQDPEECNAMQPPSLHRYLYAYANPTVYVDPSGRIEELARAAEYLRNAGTWLRDLAKEQPHNALGNALAILGPGIGRGMLVSLKRACERSTRLPTSPYLPVQQWTTPPASTRPTPTVWRKSCRRPSKPCAMQRVICKTTVHSRVMTKPSRVLPMHSVAIRKHGATLVRH